MDHYLSSTAAPQNSLYITRCKPLKVQKSEVYNSQAAELIIITMDT